MSLSSLKWKKIKKNLLIRVRDDAQLNLEQLVTMGTALDQKAANLAGVFATLATAFLAGLIALYSTGLIIIPLMIGLGISGASFLIAGIFSIRALMPVDFFICGNQPKNWLPELRRNSKIKKAIFSEILNFQEIIEHNENSIKKSAKRIRKAAWIGISAVPLGVLTFFIAKGFISCPGSV